MIIRSQNGVENTTLTDYLVNGEETVVPSGLNGAFTEQSRGGGYSALAAFYIFGITYHDTTNKKFNAASWAGSSGSASIQSTSLYGTPYNCDFGHNPFTIDFWMYANSDSDLPTINIHNGPSGTDSIGIFVGGINSIRIAYNSKVLQILPLASLDLSPYNSWNHYAIVRTGGKTYDVDTYMYFKNGVLINSVNWASADFPSNGDINIGSAKTLAFVVSQYIKIDEFRVTKGKTLWTRNFTPPTRGN